MEDTTKKVDDSVNVNQYNTFSARLSLSGNKNYFDSDEPAKKIIALAQPSAMIFWCVIVCIIIIFFMVYSLIATQLEDNNGDMPKGAAGIFWGSGIAFILGGGLIAWLSRTYATSQHYTAANAALNGLISVKKEDAPAVLNAFYDDPQKTKYNPSWHQKLLSKVINGTEDNPTFENKIIDTEADNSIIWLTIIAIVVSIIFLIIAVTVFNPKYPSGNGTNWVFFFLWGILPIAAFGFGIAAQRYYNTSDEKVGKINNIAMRKAQNATSNTVIMSSV